MGPLFASAYCPTAASLWRVENTTNLVEVLPTWDPFTIRWPIPDQRKSPTGWNAIGDAMSVVLSNGQFMLANAITTCAALFQPIEHDLDPYRHR